MALDVAVEEQWREVAAMVGREYGRLDALVNNAAIGSIATVEDEEVEHWDRVMSVGVNWRVARHEALWAADRRGRRRLDREPVLDPRHGRRLR